MSNDKLYEEMEDYDNSEISEDEQREIWDEIVHDYNADNDLSIHTDTAIRNYKSWKLNKKYKS